MISETSADQSIQGGSGHLGMIVKMCVCVEEEINNMKMELDKLGIQMPAFNKIGGILANELSVDEAAGKDG